MNFKIIDDADLSQQDFADMVGISRMALHKLITNGNIQRIEQGLIMLERLVENGKLPRGYARSDRASREALVKKLKAHLAARIAS